MRRQTGGGAENFDPRFARPRDCFFGNTAYPPWEMIRCGLFLEALAVGALAGLSSRALAVDALSFPVSAAGDTAAFMNGGCGWSFVPTTNIVITSVGYLDLVESGGNPDTVVTIWSNTNAVLASYTGITDPSADPNTIISAPIPSLLLAAGQTYAVTVYDAPLSGSVTTFAVHDNSGTVVDNPFLVAPELSHYQGLQLSQGGAFSPLSSDPALNQQFLWLGPTFTYEIFVPHPILTIAAVGNKSVQLSWPTNAVGFSLQSCPAVAGFYSPVTNTPSVSGTNYSTTLPATNAAVFFRLAKPN